MSEKSMAALRDQPPAICDQLVEQESDSPPVRRKPSPGVVRDEECVPRPLKGHSQLSPLPARTGGPVPCQHEQFNGATSKGKRLYEKHLKVVYKAVFAIRALWYDFGVELSVPPSDLDAIREDNQNNSKHCLREVLLQRIRSPTGLTWEAIIQALQEPTIGHNKMAVELERKCKACLFEESQELSPDICPTAIDSTLPRYISAAHPDSLLPPATSTLTPLRPLNSSREKNSELMSYRRYLQSRYQSQASTSTTQYLPLPTGNVIKLAMIKKEKIQRGRIDDEFVRLSITGKVDDILQLKVPIRLEDILSKTEDKREVVLMEGAPGSGKSTLSLHICQLWGKGGFFDKFLAAILVRLRDPRVQEAKTIADLLPCTDKAMAKRVESAMIESYGKGVLWVLDGYDELPTNLPADSIVLKLIQPDLSQESPVHDSSVIITSRPVSSADLHSNASSRIELLGFTPEELKQFFSESLNGDSKAVETLLSRIQDHPVVESSCYLPLNAAFIANAFLAGEYNLPSTNHGIFSSVVRCSLERYIQDRLGKKCPKFSITSAESIPQELQVPFRDLCRLAYYGVTENKVTFTTKDLDRLQIPVATCEVGLLQAVPSMLADGQEVYHCFLHLSIQELLAAIHISHMPASVQISVFKRLFGQARFGPVFQFYAGITKLNTSRKYLSRLPRPLCPVPASTLDLVRKIIKKEKSKEYEESKCLLFSLLHCLYEAEDASLCQFVADQLKRNLNLGYTTLSPTDCLAVGHFLSVVSSTTSGVFKVSLNSCSMGDNGCKFLARGLYKCLDSHSTAATSLDMDLEDNNIREEGAHHIAGVLSTSSVIQKLSLAGNPIGGVLKSLCAALMTNTKLTELYMSNCNLDITEESGASLTQLLSSNDSIKILDMSGNSGVSDLACRYLGEGLKQNKSLTLLIVAGCQISDNGLEHLSSALTVNNSLEELQFHGNDDITKAGAEMLRKSLLRVMD